MGILYFSMINVNEVVFSEASLWNRARSPLEYYEFMMSLVRAHVTEGMKNDAWVRLFDFSGSIVKG